MKILLLAPHPFYQERGTPIAVRLLVKALAEEGHCVDILTYHEGADLDLGPAVRILRSAAPHWIRNIRPGFSIKKVICDLYMHPHARRLARQNSYDCVHAIEESVFMAMSLKRHFGLPFVYDMDSSLPQQLAEKQPLFRMVGPPARALERRAIRQAACVVPMCDALADLARHEGARRVFVLRDIPLTGILPLTAAGSLPVLNGTGVRFMYIGNLEGYQGLDLLLDSFAAVHARQPRTNLAVIGGRQDDVDRYRRRAKDAGIGNAVQFTGPLPVGMMDRLFAQADVLVSPRIKGVNTPMKIYSYLMSGKAVLATGIASHTQVMPSGTALLAAPEVAAFSAAMQTLADDADLRARLGKEGKALAEREYSYPAFRRNVAAIYEWLAAQSPSSATPPL